MPHLSESMGQYAGPDDLNCNELELPDRSQTMLDDKSATRAAATSKFNSCNRHFQISWC